MLNFFRMINLKKILNYVLISFLFGFVISGIINIGDYFQVGFFDYLNDVEFNELNYSYTGFPTYAEFFKSHLLNNIFISIFIVAPCLFFKNSRGVFYAGIISAIIFISIKDAYYIYMYYPDGNRYYESFISNVIGSPFISGFIVLLFSVKNKLSSIGADEKMKVLLSILVFLFIYIVLSIFCYLFILFFNKPMPVNFMVEAKDDYVGELNNLLIDKSVILDGESNGSGIKVQGVVKKVNFESQDKINVKIAFFADCLSKPPVKFPDNNYLRFENVKNISYIHSSDKEAAFMDISDVNNISSYSSYDWKRLQLHKELNSISYWIFGEDAKLKYQTSNAGMTFSIVIPSFFDEPSKNLIEAERGFYLKINGIDEKYNVKVKRIKLSNLNKKVDCRWLDSEKIKNGSLILDPNISIGMVLLFSLDQNSYIRYFDGQGSTIVFDGVNGVVLDDGLAKEDEPVKNKNSAELKESKSSDKYINYSFKSNRIDHIQLFDVSKLIVDGSPVDVKDNTSVFLFGDDIKAWFDDKNNISIAGKTGNIFVDNKRITKTLWERFDFFSIILISITGILSPFVIKTFRYIFVVIKENNNVN